MARLDPPAAPPLYAHAGAESFRAAWHAAVQGRGGAVRAGPLPVPAGIPRAWSLSEMMAAYAQANGAAEAGTVSNQPVSLDPRSL